MCMFLEGVYALPPSTLSHQTGVSNYTLKYTKQVARSGSAVCRFWSVFNALEVFCISEWLHYFHLNLQIKKFLIVCAFRFVNLKVIINWYIYKTFSYGSSEETFMKKNENLEYLLLPRNCINYRTTVLHEPMKQNIGIFQMVSTNTAWKYSLFTADFSVCPALGRRQPMSRPTKTHSHRELVYMAGGG